MSITIGDWTFDHVLLDEEADVVYLSIGDPRPARSEETPEGHVLRYDVETGEFCGLTLIGIGRLIDEYGEVSVSIPRREHVPVEELGLAAA